MLEAKTSDDRWESARVENTSASSQEALAQSHLEPCLHEASLGAQPRVLFTWESRRGCVVADDGVKESHQPLGVVGWLVFRCTGALVEWKLRYTGADRVFEGMLTKSSRALWSLRVRDAAPHLTQEEPVSVQPTWRESFWRGPADDSTQMQRPTVRRNTPRCVAQKDIWHVRRHAIRKEDACWEVIRMFSPSGGMESASEGGESACRLDVEATRERSWRIPSYRRTVTRRKASRQALSTVSVASPIPEAVTAACSDIIGPFGSFSRAFQPSLAVLARISAWGVLVL